MVLTVTWPPVLMFVFWAGGYVSPWGLRFKPCEASVNCVTFCGSNFPLAGKNMKYSAPAGHFHMLEKHTRKHSYLQPYIIKEICYLQGVKEKYVEVKKILYNNLLFIQYWDEFRKTRKAVYRTIVVAVSTFRIYDCLCIYYRVWWSILSEHLTNECIIIKFP